MSRPPQYDVSLDLLERPLSLDDYTSGDASLIRSIEIRQHALVCGWGTPAHVVTFDDVPDTYSSVSTRIILVRVPPYCKRMRVACLLWGSVKCTLQALAFGETTEFASNARTVEAATWDEGSTLESSPGNSTGCLPVLEAAVNAWSTVRVTLRLKSGRGQLLSLAFYPVLEQAV
jgi:hypothetical protein